jgi:drug/metabolite transporter (DMT)-like permease
MSDPKKGALFALLAAAAFGLATPFAKVLLPGAGPLLLAGILYLGGGLTLTLVGLVRKRSSEAPLQRSDWPMLAGVILAGGVVGPVLMLVGLQRLSGVSSALLLNLEAPLTILIALVVFHEHLGRREAFGAAAIILGTGLLAGWPTSDAFDGWGVAAIAGACLSWAIDNNLTQRLSTRDPLQVVRVKTLAAGSCNLVLAFAFGAALPRTSVVFPSLALGAVSYGLSIVASMYSLRLLGAARQAAYFATAPFLGAIASLVVLKEHLAPPQWIAGGLMAFGVLTLTRERHSHDHAHESLQHEHRHVHDEHHQHPHAGPVEEPHSHAHRHAAISHAHPHASDVHHRHSHR